MATPLQLLNNGSFSARSVFMLSLKLGEKKKEANHLKIVP